MVMQAKGKNGKKDMMKKEDTEKVKTGALTAAQKKLPPALQAAILKKMKK
jgi:hypothetical protein